MILEIVFIVLWILAAIGAFSLDTNPYARPLRAVSLILFAILGWVVFGGRIH